MAKKVPVPKVKTRKLSLGDKFWGGIAGLSTLIKHPNLYRSLSEGSELGARKLARLKAARIAKYGKWGAKGVGGVSGLLNPRTAVPFALGYGAKHAVGSALEGYKNQDVEDTGSGPLWLFDNRGISEEGAERLLQERLAREKLARASAAKRGELAWMDDPNFDFWGGGLKASKLADYPELAEKYDMNEGGIARLL